MSLLSVETSTDMSQSERHELATAPLVTCDANNLLTQENKLVQYGLLGAIQSMRCV
jgi:hypothetical protein